MKASVGNYYIHTYIHTYIHKESVGRVDGEIVCSRQIRRKDESNTKIRVRERHWKRKR